MFPTVGEPDRAGLYVVELQEAALDAAVPRATDERTPGAITSPDGRPNVRREVA
jgi:hypothetical protein